MKNNMMQKLGVIGILTGLVTGVFAQGIARADIPGNHPYYLHARSDLRKAERLLQLPEEANVKQEELVALREIHRTIWEIDRAAVLDRKDVDDNPTIDTSLRHKGKFREIERLLQSAKRDIDHREDNSAARPWQYRANAHLRLAEQRVQIALRRDRFDDQQQWHR